MTAAKKLRQMEALGLIPAGTLALVCVRCGTVRPLLAHLPRPEACGTVLAGPLPACAGRLEEVAR